MFENPMFHKTIILLDIWHTQKKLVYLLNEFDDFSKRKPNSQGCCSIENPNRLSYKEQYISFLMNNNLIFLEETKEPEILLNLIYYWLLAEVKCGKDILNSF